jgi:hypothetical protein
MNHASRSTGSIVAIVAGAVIGLVAVALLIGGGVLLWGDGHKDDDGYLSTSAHRFATSTYAVSSGNMDLNLDAPGWLIDRDRYGTLRVKATPQSGKPVFVGIARTAAVSSYLSGTAHASVDDLDFWPFRVTYRAHPGSQHPLPPAEQGFWAASANGAGTQAVTWKVRDGNWSIVVMNADGSRGVDARVSAGATVPFLATAGWWTLIAGLVVLAGAAGLVVVGVRSGRRTAVAA